MGTAFAAVRSDKFVAFFSATRVSDPFPAKEKRRSCSCGLGLGRIRPVLQVLDDLAELLDEVKEPDELLTVPFFK